jgi:type I restriction enzyme, S subunit
MLLNASRYNQHWQDKSLNELGNFQRGKSRHRPRNDVSLFVNGKHPLIQTGEIKETNLFITKHSATYNDSGLAQSKLWQKNTLCITIAANIAETALLGYPMCFPDSVVGFNADPSQSSEIFMHYVFTYIRRAIQSSATGSIQDNINIEYLTSLKFKVPPKSNQDQIAGILSTLDAKIDCNNRINSELEAMAKTLYDYWFVQFDFPAANGKPYKSSGGKMVYNEALKMKVPVGWEVVAFASYIASDKTGDWGKETLEDNYKLKVDCIRGADINGLNGSGRVTAPTRYILEKNSTKILAPFDAVVEISGGSPTQSTGRMALIVPDMLSRFQRPLICSNFCKAICIKDPLTYAYNFHYEWQRAYDNKVLFGWEGKTSGIKNLLFDSFVNKYLVVKPSKEIAQKFFDFANPMQIKKQKLLQENEELAKLRDWLLPLLMNGQVTVQ